MFFQKDPCCPERDRRVASVAVAPFDPLPLSREEARVAMGFLEDVISELARVSDIEVLAARTSLSLKPEALDPRRMAEAYGVTHMLDSSIRPGAEGLRVKASLIDTQAGNVIWSRGYEAPFRRAGEVLEDIAAEVASHMANQVRLTRLVQARARPLASLKAQDCWLRGLEQLRLSTPEGNEEARRLFERALSTDACYARAYAGLSLSHFKRWNWRRGTEQEAEDERLSLEYARKAEALDDLDPVVQVVLGRNQVYRRAFAEGRHHLERAEQISPNEADSLMQMAPLWAYLGDADRAQALAAKAFRLNPLHEPWYYFLGFVPLFLARRIEDAVGILERSPPHMIFEQSALMAACYAHLGRTDEAAAQVPAFLEAFRRDILSGREPAPGEALQHILDSNPFARDEDRAFLVEGLARAGLTEGAPPPRAAAPTAAREARFVRKGGLLETTFAGRTVQLADAKGCRDLAMLLASPRERIHCMELAGRLVEGDSGAAMDARARAECQRRIQDLQAEMAEAERHNDFARTERLGEELDGVIEQLSAAVGLGGRGRKLGDPAEKARTAVTWRIRNAIKKIAEVHPELGRHLEASIRTGSFCAYQPEHPVRWQVT